jgi:riboflavin synthase
MFSGIVETTSPIVKIQDSPGQRVFTIRKPAGWKLRAGESVSVEGVCSTVQKNAGQTFQVTYMQETLRKTTLGKFEAGDAANLERSLTLASLIGGHLVQGHVDTTAKIRSIKSEGEAKIYEFHVHPYFSKYIVEKGSIAVDGVSLTVVASRPGRFTVSLLAFTMSRTTLGRKRVGDMVNIEVDVLAKYIEKLLPK